MIENYQTIESERIYLRKVVPGDVTDAYHQWMNDEEVTKFLEVRFRSWSKQDIRDYVASMGNRDDVLFLAICLTENNRHIGNIKLGPVDKIHRFAEIGIVIGDRRCWGRGLASETISLLAGYAFDYLGLNRLSAGCYENNPASLKAFEKAGFRIEGVRREMRWYRDRFVDQIVLGLLKREWEEAHGR